MNNINGTPIVPKLGGSRKPSSEIMTWHCNGNGFGAIAPRYYCGGKVSSLTVEMLSKHKGGKNGPASTIRMRPGGKDILSLGQLRTVMEKRTRETIKSGAYSPVSKPLSSNEGYRWEYACGPSFIYVEIIRVSFEQGPRLCALVCL